MIHLQVTIYVSADGALPRADSTIFMLAGTWTIGTYISVTDSTKLQTMRHKGSVSNAWSLAALNCARRSDLRN